MTTNELIAELQRRDPTGEAQVEIPVRVATKVYPAAYVAPLSIEMGPWGKVRINCSLPDGMTVMNRKQAA